MSLGSALHEDVVARIRTDHVKQLVSRHEVVRTLAETNRLARLLQVDQLIDDDRHRLGRRAQCLYYRMHPGDVPVVVSTPNIDDATELPHEQLVVVVRNIGTEV